jgi:hypothetical protein
MSHSMAPRDCQSRLKLMAVCSSNAFACWRRATSRTFIPTMLSRGTRFFLKVICQREGRHDDQTLIVQGLTMAGAKKALYGSMTDQLLTSRRLSERGMHINSTEERNYGA